MPRHKTIYDIIKHQNGERFAKAIRNYDSGIFDIPNLPELVKYAGREAEPIMDYLVSLKHIKIKDKSVHANPIELLARAGYDAYVADTLEKQNAIRKYFARGEELCTFNDEYRYQNYYIVNAVRYDVDKIIRPPYPQRQDAYGTSVISIQILKRGGFISIKNRYNHVVVNPDNTFGSNPDNIIEGLADALRAYFDVDFSAHYVELPDKYTTVGNHIVKYNQEIDNIYYGPDFYVQDGNIIQLDNATELLLGNGLLLNLCDKCVYEIGDVSVAAASITKQIKDKKLSVRKSADGTKSIFANNTHVLDVKDGLMNWVMPLSGRDFVFTNLPLKGNLDFNGFYNYISLAHSDLSNVTKLNFGSRAKYIDLQCSGGLAGDIDFGNAQQVTLMQSSLDHVQSMKFGPKTKIITLDHVQKLGCDLDFSNAENINLHSVNLRLVKNIKFGPKTKQVKMNWTCGLNGILDFAGAKSIDLSYADLKDVKFIKFGPDVHEVNMPGVMNLFKTFSGKLDFTSVKHINLTNADLFGVKDMKIGAAKTLYLTHSKGLSCPLDLSAVWDLEMVNSDISNVPYVIFNPRAQKINLRFTAGLSGNLDFGKVAHLALDRADLSHVTGIRFNPSGKVDGVSKQDCKKWTEKFYKAQQSLLNDARAAKNGARSK